MAGRFGFKIVSALHSQGALATRKIRTTARCPTHQHGGGASPSLTMLQSSSSSHRQRTTVPPRLVNEQNLLVGGEEPAPLNTVSNVDNNVVDDRSHSRYGMEPSSPIQEPSSPSIERNFSSSEPNMVSRQSNLTLNEPDTSIKASFGSREPNTSSRQSDYSSKEYNAAARVTDMALQDDISPLRDSPGSRLVPLDDFSPSSGPKSKIADYVRPNGYENENAPEDRYQLQPRQVESERYHSSPREFIDEGDRYQSSYQTLNQDESQSSSYGIQDEIYNPQLKEDKYGQSEQNHDSNLESHYKLKQEEQRMQKKKNDAVQQHTTNQEQPQTTQQWKKPKWWSEVRAFKDDKVVIRIPEALRSDTGKMKKIDGPCQEKRKTPKLDEMFLYSQTAAEQQLRGLKNKLNEERNKKLRYASMSGRDWVQYLARKRDGLCKFPSAKLRDPQISWVDPPVDQHVDGLDSDEAGVEPIERADIVLESSKTATDAPELKNVPSRHDTIPPPYKPKQDGYCFGYGLGNINPNQPSGTVRAAANIRTNNNRGTVGTNKRPNPTPDSAVLPARKRRHAYFSTYSKQNTSTLRD